MKKAFQSAIQSGFRQYTLLSGRASRAEYWYWQLFTALVSVGTTLLDIMMGSGSQGFSLSFMGLVILYLPTIAVTVRRFHDINRSGWWLALIMVVNVVSYGYWVQGAGLISLLPLAGSLSTLVCWCVRKGDSGRNRFGEDPFKQMSFVA